MRRLAIVALVAVASALVFAPSVATPASAAAQPASVGSGHDYATAVLHDPWDYSNPSDLLTDTGPTQGLANPSMSGGLFSFTVHSGYLSPLWGGYKSQVPIGRDGTLAANRLNAGTYTRLRVHIYVSAFTAGGFSWTPCAAMTSACMGSMSFALRAGWNDLDMPIVRSRSTGRAWTGYQEGLRLALTAPSGSVLVHLDRLRIYRPSRTVAFAWASPNSSPAQLWWTDQAGTISAAASQHAGRVANAAASPSSSAQVGANVAGYPPQTYFWAVADNGAKTLVGQSVASPLPVIDTPSAAGCGDYATSYLGRPWTFTSGSSMAAHANMTAISFNAAGVMTATNAGPNRNDPNLSLPIARGGINGLKYHRLTIVESYDGAFNLANAPGGGSMARILWQTPGHISLSQTAPLVTYSGKRSLTVDMAMPSSQLIEKAGTAAQQYPFASTSPVTRLRYDPNEDPGARRWHLYSVRLAHDCQAALSSTVSWHDAQYSPGSTMRLEARTAGGHTHPLGTFTEGSGPNSQLVSVRSVPRGTYTVAGYVTNAAGVTSVALSSGPLVITR